MIILYLSAVLSQISIQKDIIGKANFFFNKQLIEEADSLATEEIDVD